MRSKVPWVIRRIQDEGQPVGWDDVDHYAIDILSDGMQQSIWWSHTRHPRCSHSRLEAAPQDAAHVTAMKYTASRSRAGDPEVYVKAVREIAEILATS